MPVILIIDVFISFISAWLTLPISGFVVLIRQHLVFVVIFFLLSILLVNVWLGSLLGKQFYMLNF